MENQQILSLGLRHQTYHFAIYFPLDGQEQGRIPLQGRDQARLQRHQDERRRCHHGLHGPEQGREIGIQ